ncbi:MAG: hypothetical protein QF733_02890 [Phycisphaerales bacterium]|jgi:hypothetical protein|nr:hypothetical protein [Phycisphaerales bacterium]
MSPPRTFNARGVALLDVILAALMLGVGLSVTLSLASQALRAEQTGERRLTASWLADEALAMVVAVGPSLYSQSEPTSGYFDPPFDRYEWVLDMNQPSDWGPWDVAATVTWQDRSGPMSVRIATKVAPRQGDIVDDPFDWKPEEPLDREERQWGADDESGLGSEP